MSIRPRATLDDVARAAGVSPITVSRVINRPELVATTTRTRVEEAIDELDFRLDYAARALASRRSRLIGVLITGIAQHSHSKRSVAFNEAAREFGYEVVQASIPNADREQVVDATNVMLSQRAEAIVLIAADATGVEVVQGLKLPVPVIYAESGSAAGSTSVSIDQSLGARLAVRHLAELGHRRISHIAGPSWSLDASERRRGWQSELERLGLPLADAVDGDWSAESGFAAANTILDRDTDVTAIFVSSDQMALGALHALFERGMHVPTDMSIVGFDDIPGAAHFIPPLTTVRQDFMLLAAELLGAVIAELDGQHVESRVPSPPELVLRSSTAAVAFGTGS
jgi:DNA-binding LacI/PurR family transcriptional regulator